MPITFHTDPKQRRVTAMATGSISEVDFLECQRDAWSPPAVADYDELVDMTQVDRIHGANPDSVKQLALRAASMDAVDKHSKFAIVAPQDALFGLGRMYATWRSDAPNTMKEVSVFRSREDAERWLQAKAD
jgi:hypothetical protein